MLPPSVLFWGRRVYWGVAMLVLTALKQGRREGYTVRRLCGLFDTLTRSTLSRWVRYFREIFPQTGAWVNLAARLMPVASPESLGDLIERFMRSRDDPEHALVGCLTALCVGP